MHNLPFSTELIHYQQHLDRTLFLRQTRTDSMKIIAESSSTRTEWAIVDGNKIIESAVTMGMNPFFQTRREISHSIRLELPESFFRKRWDHIYYYGAGCATPEKCKIMELSLVAQFKTPVTVESDLLGAARGLLVRNPGIACILGTGSNSCVYDGDKIIRNVRPLGYILGDEGSGADIGKQFLGDCLKGLAPEELASEFIETYEIKPDTVMDDVYTRQRANVLLSSYSEFLNDHLTHPYVETLVYNSMMRFFSRNLSSYDYKNTPVSIVGSVACRFQTIVEKAAADFGLHLEKVIRNSLPGLVEYHAAD